MPWLLPKDRFNPDISSEAIVGVAGHLEGHDSGFHKHDRGQLLFTQSGCVNIHLPNRLCMLPPTRIAWIPPGIPHRAQMTGPVDYRSIYFDVTRYSGLPSVVEVMDVTPLLRAALEKIATAEFATNWETGAGANVVAVCLDEIHVAHRQPMLLPLPSDVRLSTFNTNELPPLLREFAASQGASEKTIGRIFRSQTGMSYQQWRQQWRLLKAVELLGQGQSTTSAAFDLGFASDSAFIAFFKGMTGYTPRRFMGSTPGSTNLHGFKRWACP